MSNSNLELFLAEISRLTGLRICVYDLNYFTEELSALKVPDQRRIHCSPLCEKVKSHPEARAKCIETEYARAEAAGKCGGAYIHTCHAGLTDLVLPLYLGQRQIGALYLGQAITQTPRQHQATLRRLSRTYEFSLKELEALSARQMPHSTRRQLASHEVLLTLIKEYIQQAEELAAWEKEIAAAAPSSARLRRTLSIEKVPVLLLDKIHPQSAEVCAALQILRGRYWKKLTQATVAREVGLSQSHFSRQFHAETGMTFRDCLLKTRISAARFLLKKTDYSVSEIARLLGYSSAPAFVRAFKTYTHCSPHQFLRTQAFSTYFDEKLER
jgi:AraC-like DNA-binding protein